MCVWLPCTTSKLQLVAASCTHLQKTQPGYPAALSAFLQPAPPVEALENDRLCCQVGELFTGNILYQRLGTDILSEPLAVGSFPPLCVLGERGKPLFFGGVPVGFLGPPVVPFDPFLGRVPLLKQTTEKSWYPYSNLSTGGPSCLGAVSQHLKFKAARVFSSWVVLSPCLGAIQVSYMLRRSQHLGDRGGDFEALLGEQNNNGPMNL